MRIALLPSAFAPSIGGVEVLTEQLARQLLQNGHEVEVWTARSPGDALPVLDSVDGLRVRRFVFFLPGLRPRAIARFPGLATSTMRRLQGACREFEPDVMHVQCFSGNGAYATALSRFHRVPLVVSLQGETLMDDTDIYVRSALLRTALRLGLIQAAAVTGCSQFVLDDAIARFGLRGPKGEVIHNGIDPDERPVGTLSVPFDRYVLGLGRVVHKKGFDLLLDAYSSIAGEHSEVGLVIGGEGPEVEWLRARALAIGIARRVHFTGSLDRAAVAGAMRGASAVVVPSRLEPFGIVALEAWRAGTPVIASSRGGMPEFVEHGVTGLVVDPFETRELAVTISRVLKSAELRADLTAVAGERLERFTWPAIAAQYERIYARVT
jgi:glycosyltransferase involved in cell wall biosynthesis